MRIKYLKTRECIYIHRLGGDDWENYLDASGYNHRPWYIIPIGDWERVSGQLKEVFGVSPYYIRGGYCKAWDKIMRLREK